MPFQPINFAAIEPAGNPAARNLISNLMQGYQAGLTPQIMQRQAEKEELSNAFQRLQNKYYPEQQQLEMALKNSQLKYAGPEHEARLRLLQAQSGGAEADLKDRLRQAALNQQFFDLIKNAQSGQNAAPLQNGQVPFAPETRQQLETQIPDQQTQATQDFTRVGGAPGYDAIDKIYMEHPEFRKQFKSLGFGGSSKVEINPSTGQAFTENILPSGATEIRAVDVGRKPEDVRRAQKLAEADVDIYKAGNSAINDMQDMNENLTYIKNTLASIPNAENVVGPINSVATKYFGTDEQKNLLGAINSISGNITLQAAKSIKGAFTGRDQGLLAGIKPNSNDTLGEFIGKINALSNYNDLATKRMQLINDYISKGYNSTDAIKIARMQTDFSKYGYKKPSEKINATFPSQVRLKFNLQTGGFE